VRFPKDLVLLAEGSSQSDTDQSGDLYLTPGFWRRYGPDLASSRIDLAVELQRGFADEEAFDAAVVDRFGGQANLAVIGGGREEEPALLAGVQRAISFETLALLLFAVLAVLSMVLLVSQTLGRQVFLAATEDPTLRALGMTRRQLVGVALVRAGVIGAGGAALAMGAAVALSPLTPIGLARLAEPAPGVAADGSVLAVGALAIVAVVAGCAALPAWRAARIPGDPLGVMDLAGLLRPSRLAARLGGAVPPTVALGVRLALEPGRGRTAVPVRAALAGTVAAVCAVTAAASFGPAWPI
jgi:FtsX-like permease family